MNLAAGADYKKYIIITILIIAIAVIGYIIFNALFVSDDGIDITDGGVQPGTCTYNACTQQTVDSCNPGYSPRLGTEVVDSIFCSGTEPSFEDSFDCTCASDSGGGLSVDLSGAFAGEIPPSQRACTLNANDYDYLIRLNNDDKWLTSAHTLEQFRQYGAHQWQLPSGGHNIPQGKYRITIQTQDNHSEHGGQGQLHEKVIVRFRPEGQPTVQIAQTRPSDDIPEDQDYWNTTFEQDLISTDPSLQGVPIGNVYATHGLPSDTSSPNSVLAVCIGLSEVSAPPPVTCNDPVAINRAEGARLLVDVRNHPFDTTGGPHFTDVPASHPDYQPIETIFNRGITSGIGGGLYGPDQSMTRGAYVTFAVRDLDLDLINPSTPSFTDVPTNHQFYRQIETAKLYGLIVGFGDGTFKPDEAILATHACAISSVDPTPTPTPTVTVTPTPEPDLTISKSVLNLTQNSGWQPDLTDANPGDRVLFGIGINNNGDGAANSVKLRDALPPKTTLLTPADDPDPNNPPDYRVRIDDVDMTPAQITALESGTEFEIKSSLAAGGRVEVFFQVLVGTAAQFPADETVTNTAFTRANNFSTTINDDAAIRVIAPEPGTPNLVIRKSALNLTLPSDDPERAWGTEEITASPGDRILFGMQVENIGDANAVNVVLRDVLPSTMTYLPDTTRVNDVDFADGITTGSIDLGTIPPGSANKAIIYFQATVNDADEFSVGDTTITNVAYTSATEIAEIDDDVDVIITKTATPTPTPPPGPLACQPVEQFADVDESRLLIASDGTAPYTWAAPSGNFSDDTGEQFSVSYAAGGSYTVTLTDDNGDTAECRVNVTAPTPTPTATPSPSAIFIEKLGRDITDGETIDTTPVTTEPDHEVEFLIRVTNTGGTTLNNVIVRDVLPNRIVYITGSTTIDGVAAPDGILNPGGILIGDLAPSQQKNIRFRGTVANQASFNDLTTRIINSAFVRSNQTPNEIEAQLPIDVEVCVGCVTTGVNTLATALGISLLITGAFVVLSSTPTLLQRNGLLAQGSFQHKVASDITHIKDTYGKHIMIGLLAIIVLTTTMLLLQRTTTLQIADPQPQESTANIIELLDDVIK